MTLAQVHAILLALLVVCGTLGALAILGGAISPVAADQHTYEEAEDYTDEANFTVNFPFTTDHYPGDMNTENGSVSYFTSGEQAFHDLGAEEGAFIHMVIIDAEWIDYSACDVDNTAAFGIDRGNNNQGTQIDEDLVSRRKNDDFRDDGLTVTFYDWEDFGGDPPYMAPEDAIVAEQGARSQAGACLTLTNEQGWYQIQGFLNATEADNGQEDPPSDNAETAGVTARSNYLYVCECDSEEEAREQLGPPPNENGGNGDDGNTTPEPDDDDTTPEPNDDDTTPEPNDGNTDGDTTPEPNNDTTPEPGEGETTPDDGGDTTPGTGDGQSNDGDGEVDGETTNDGDVDDGGAGGTPTPGDAPGFGPIAALIALLASTLLLYRHG